MHDVLIIGGGIVGLATAYRLTERYPGLKALVLEKEDHVAPHQTGRNSGVLHSGIYYKPGSLKATACVTGKRQLEAFCEAEGVAYDLCGKVIVAVEQSELPRLDALYQRGMANGVACEIIGPERLREIEPYTAGIRAIHIPGTGIVDYRGACERLAARLRERGSDVRFGARVMSIKETPQEIVAESTAGAFPARYGINCAGLHADRVARLAGSHPNVTIIPFRGEYYKLTPAAERFCRGLIYPVPDPAFPFLGVHFTRMTAGGVECGPNAVFAFAREGYRKRDISPRDLLEAIGFKGFRKLARKHWRMGMAEMHRSFSKAAFLRALQRLVPEVRTEDLSAAPSGVRAQAVSAEGTMVDDFAFDERPRLVNVLNAPSPAATAALAIGNLIVDRLATRL